ncbi:hypothetical protein AB0H43_13350 [Hamadaea sp. NPDC050747]|uniref:hypothetical protein n=1 Tax=Hamadaea sp. NPDC050747 TaxID=3155789 RepID=UPI0033FBFFA9
MASTLPRRFLACVGALAAGGLLAASGAVAAHAKGEYYQWNSSASPLSISGYGSTAKGYGQWRLADGSSGTRSFLDARLWYTNADNHTVYADLSTQGDCEKNTDGSYSCGAYVTDYGAETPHYNVSNTWAWKYANTAIDEISSRHRARILVCLDVPLRVDPCAGPAYAGPSYS